MSEHVGPVDDAIELDGRVVTLSRIGGPSVQVKAVMRKQVPVDLRPPLVQGEREFYISGLSMIAVGWPLPIRKGDMITTAREQFSVTSCEPVRHMGEVAKYRVRARGGFVEAPPEPIGITSINGMEGDVTLTAGDLPFDQTVHPTLGATTQAALNDLVAFMLP